MTEYAKLIVALLDAQIRFLVVGGYAAIAHGHTRATDDLDIWIDPAPDNLQKTLGAMACFGADLDGLSADDLADSSGFVRIGDDQGRKIDILSSAPCLQFSQAWRNRFETEFCGVLVPFLSLHDLIRNKEVVARHKDLADVEALRAFHRLRVDEP